MTARGPAIGGSKADNRRPKLDDAAMINTKFLWLMPHHPRQFLYQQALFDHCC
jgi:hypothetical protein